MKEEPQTPRIDPQLEARIVALVLGEASDFESDELQRLVEEQPELAALKEQIESVHGMLRDLGTGETAAVDEAWQMSAEKRSAVLAVIEGEADEPSAQAMVNAGSTRSRSGMSHGYWKLAKVAAVVGVVACLGSVAVFRMTSIPLSRQIVVGEAMPESMSVTPHPNVPEPATSGGAESNKTYAGASLESLRGTLDADSTAPTRRRSGMASSARSSSSVLAPIANESADRRERSRYGYLRSESQPSTQRNFAEFGFPALADSPDAPSGLGAEAPPPAAVSGPAGTVRLGGNRRFNDRVLGTPIYSARDLIDTVPTDDADKDSESVGPPDYRKGEFAGYGQRDDGVRGYGGGAFGGYGGEHGYGEIKEDPFFETESSFSTNQHEAGSFASQQPQDSSVPTMGLPFEAAESAEVTPADAIATSRPSRGETLAADLHFGGRGPGITRGSNSWPDSAATKMEHRVEESLGEISELDDLFANERDSTPVLPVESSSKSVDSFGVPSQPVLAGKTIESRQAGDLIVADQQLEGVPQMLHRSQTRNSRPSNKPAVAGLNEQLAQHEPFSTFSLHVSDVSFKLARAALAEGEWPAADQVRSEEFVNAFDYGDPLPSETEKVACYLEQCVHPFLQQRNLLRVSIRTAAAGRSSNTPLRLTLLLDNSGSMERPDRQQTVRRAFRLLAQQLQPTDQVTLISFARQPRLLVDQVSGAQADQLVQLVDNLPSEGGTNLEAALQLAFEKAQEQQLDGAQNRIILLTDGAVNLGDANPERLAQMITAMREAGIAFDAAGISAAGLNDEILEALTRQGDGRYYLLDSPEVADDGFARQIAGALRPSAKNVKVQVEFNPKRVGRYGCWVLKNTA